MKYSIEGFNQQALVEFGLDITDALILRWLLDFSATGKMKKILVDTKLYYMVNYEALIQEFPIFGISTTKGISKRFEKYVTLGLLKKIVRHGNQTGGTIVFFSIEASINEMMYSKCNTAEKNESSSLKIKKESKIRSAEKNESSSQNVTESNTSSSQKELEFLSNGTGVPFTLNNPSTNSSTNSSSSQIEEEISKKFDVSIFSRDFIPQLDAALTASNIQPENYAAYLEWAYDVCYQKCRQKDKFVAYYYSAVKDPYLMHQYSEHVKASQEAKVKTEKIMIECPVCSKVHNRYEECPVCDLLNYADSEEIAFRRIIWNLPTDQKNKLNKEVMNCSDSFGMEFKNYKVADFKQKKEQIYKKYCPEISHELFQAVFG